MVELLAMLDAFPDVLVVFNHPLWTQTCVGVHRDDKALERFLTCAVQFLHAFEINATRSTKENNLVRELAEQWRRPLVSGGDRHGCEASGALNLTCAETFCEFVSEIRIEQRSHVLLMPQYTEPVSIRTTRTLLDVIRNYPEYPIGSQRWDERSFSSRCERRAGPADLGAMEGATEVCGADLVGHPAAGECDCATRDGARFQTGSDARLSA